MFKGKHYYLGYFNDENDAIKARKQAEERLHDEFLEWYNENYKK